MNRATIIGRLTRDVDLRYTQSGKAVGNFTLAVNRPFKNQQGENEADFINCVSWGKQAESLAQYMKKGNQVGVDGRIQTRTYDDKDGKTVFVTEIIAEYVQFLESKGSSDNQQSRQQQDNDFKGDTEPLDITDDDLPF